MQLKKGDIVKAIAGASRGKVGKVIKVIGEKQRIVVEGLNMKKKNTRPRKQGQKGQIIEFPASLHISNAALVCPKCGKTARLAAKVVPGERKRRMCAECKQALD